MKVDNEIVYTGYFWPSLSSISCNWIVIDPVSTEINNEMKVELGYPSPAYGTDIPDKRNSNQIIDVFRRDNKLVE